MILGRLGDTTGRPYIEGRLALPQLSNNPWALCSFIVDTGAERSVLVPVDARRMGLDRSLLDPAQRTSTYGIGGEAWGYDALGLVMLKDPDRNLVYEFRVRLFIPDVIDAMNEIDGSVLGRDVLDCGVLTYDGPARRVSFDVKHSEVEHPVPVTW